jgi:hypothetical protein
MNSRRSTHRIPHAGDYQISNWLHIPRYFGYIIAIALAKLRGQITLFLLNHAEMQDQCCRDQKNNHPVRRGYLRSPRWFSWTWTRDGERVASINVETQRQTVTLKYRSRSYKKDWSDVEQRIPIGWTPCRFGGERPWFVCSVYSSGRYCGRRVTKLYGAGRLFACRKCYQLAYTNPFEFAVEMDLVPAKPLQLVGIEGLTEGLFADYADMTADEAMTRRALDLLGSKRNDAYEAALAALREDTQEWWADILACNPDEIEEGEEPATADVEGLRNFIEGEVLPWFENRKKELANRPFRARQLPP